MKRAGGFSLFESQLHSLPLLKRGKVRDIYTVDDQHLLIIATDRLSAFDVILPTPIPDKGAILTALSNFWFDFTQSLIPNHRSDMTLEAVFSDRTEYEQVSGRAVIVKKCMPLPVEAIVRGYIAGSGWKDYQKTGAICSLTLPPGLQLGEKLPRPIYTPSSKAEVGQHDENIDFSKTCALIGQDLAAQVRDLSLEIYSRACDYAAKRGIIIADTKFEFGVDTSGQLVLIDEVLTPDSSRFWPVDQYEIGRSPPNFDKQFVRDYLETLDWDKKAPGPALPASIVEKTRAKYQEARQRLVQNA
ncbi:MAG: phosphoribosylaminoimidazolesuccinocarboxamide synthase [Candidatus Parabeggiatoa sp. nov. 3]|nr:MAG: phosphoribosylaminoimidazolesuccinocarboxamide synthase [Gammaproteobacteria bacterium]RKZ65863.1 MAG: phosphoribosylaminoimidazolesuccinocarboxamide synthase [Gammaproteobacteria bacterium]RKZ87345.1 MAG: phosphoribosylaminoimidazolesuccinocarboxamide synthase [Gammaproteobacteria bacterium]